METNKVYHHIDHTHCWCQDNPPCGNKIKHFKCCLCELPHPEIAQAEARGAEKARQELLDSEEMIEDVIEIDNPSATGFPEAVNYGKNQAITAIRKKVESLKQPVDNSTNSPE